MRHHVYKTGVVIITLLALASKALAIEQGGSQILGHTWASKKLDVAVWGVACGDVNGDEKEEIVLLGQNAVHIASIDSGDLKIEFSHTWKSELRGVRLFLKNLDADPQEEIIVSAVFNDRPASFILKFDGGSFQELAKDILWHLRVMGKGVDKRLIGQRSNQVSFFAGDIYDVRFENGKIKTTGKISLPWQAALYNFAMLTTDEIVLLKNDGMLVLMEKRGRKFKKVSTLGTRYGGSLNVVEASSREPLGITNDGEVVIGREPEVSVVSDGPVVVATWHESSLHGAIGRRLFIRAGKLTFLKPDASFGLVEALETEGVPGYISDFALDGQKKILVSVLQNPSIFERQHSVLLMYELPY